MNGRAVRIVRREFVAFFAFQDLHNLKRELVIWKVTDHIIWEHGRRIRSRVTHSPTLPGKPFGPK